MTEQIDLFNHWGRAASTIVLASLFIFSFIPFKKRGWKALGITEAFVVALYTEMYGFPLTIYLLTSILGMDIPLIHIKGHLWSTLLGWGETGAMIEMATGDLITVLGVGLVIAGWRKIYRAKTEDLVTTGIYAYIRHPQYTGIILAALGTFVHWPTLPTLLMLPILIAAYYKLAEKEEREMESKFGQAYREYQERVPRFWPSPRVLWHLLKPNLYSCPECGLRYQEKKWKDQCEAWCKEYQSCNLEITKHAEQRKTAKI